MIEIILQALGYIASVLLAISLMVNNDLQFRWLNTFGCLAFILYGIFIGALPVILTNSLLLLINLIYLIKIYRAKEKFDLLEFTGEETLAKKFLSFYQKDIEKYFPDFQPEATGKEIRFVVLRDLVIANMFIANVKEEGSAEVKLNYTVPKYRDYKVGRFIFEKENSFLRSKGINQIIYTDVKNRNHEKFIVKMGFRKNNDPNTGNYSKSLI